MVGGSGVSKEEVFGEPYCVCVCMFEMLMQSINDRFLQLYFCVVCHMPDCRCLILNAKSTMKVISSTLTWIWEIGYGYGK